MRRRPPTLQMAKKRMSRNPVALAPQALQSPPFIYANGAIRPWAEAMLHVSTEAVQRGINVFEGLKGFWQPDGRFGLVTMQAHFARLQRSAKLMHIPFEMSFEAYDDACHALCATMLKPESNMWLRTTLFLTEGHWGIDDKTDLVITAYQHPKGIPTPFATGVSTWRRANDNALPARIKMGSNYLVARFAKIEGRSRSYPEMVLLNEAGRVAEFIGSGLLMVRNGVVYTPPASEGAFESLTTDICEALAADLGIPFERRPIERTELIIADEIASIGTLRDICLIDAFEEKAMGPAPLLTRLQQRYLDAVTGIAPHPAAPMSTRSVDLQKPAARS